MFKGHEDKHTFISDMCAGQAVSLLDFYGQRGAIWSRGLKCRW